MKELESQHGRKRGEAISLQRANADQTDKNGLVSPLLICELCKECSRALVERNRATDRDRPIKLRRTMNG